MEFPRLKDIRVDKDVSQDAVAEHLHLQRTVYGRYERGEREVPAWVIYELAVYYKVSANYILGLVKGKKDNYPPE